MTPEMTAAFQLGAGFSVAGFYGLLAATLAAALLIWGGWTVAGQYRTWAEGRGGIDRLFWAIGTVLVLVTLLLTYL